jgi:four helix bundle protein
MPGKGYKDLEVWKKAVDLAVEVYEITRRFPDSEKFGLSIQMRRAAVSVPSNIAEGHARGTSKEFQRFLNIALGSLFELETQALLSARLGFLKKERYGSLNEEMQRIGRMLRGLARKLPGGAQ